MTAATAAGHVGTRPPGTMARCATASDGAADPRPSGATTSPARVRVLVVDDSLDHRELMARRLRSTGMQVAAVGSAEEAVERCGAFDLVVLDLRLPGTDDLEVLTAIRDRPQPPSVVMVTAAGSTEVAVEAMRAGAAHFLSKDRGYLDALPEVVARAWRTHDLERRATELQRAAVVLTATADLPSLAHEVAHTARRLAAAAAVRLRIGAVEGGAPVTVELGAPPEAPDAELPRGDARSWDEADGRAVVTLPGDPRPAGILELWPQVPMTADEHELLRAFAALAGTALGNVRRLDLQRRLVQELERTLEARQDFIASISHELRTPLTAISGFSHTLRTHGAAMAATQARQLLDRIHRNADELGSLVDELLELASLERGHGVEPTVTRLDLGSCLHEVLEELAPVLEGHRVDVALTTVGVLGDPQLVRRTLTNLLSNAAKFSRADRNITVASDVVDGQVRVTVEDHGIGLQPWQARHVFEAFYRTSSSVSDAVRGSGIGLALVARYVRSMGGEVGVDSVPGDGSTFWFTLPAADAAAV